MTQEKEFSFLRFFKFAMRYFLVGVLLVALGLGIGAATTLSTEKTNYEKYTATMTLNVANYAAASGISTTDATVLSGQASQIMEAAGAESVRSQAFATLYKEIYPAVTDETDKLRLFNANLEIKYGTASLTVSFIYDVTAESAEQVEKNRALAQRVIASYLEIARMAVREQYPVLNDDATFAKVFSISRVQPSYDLSESVLESNKGVSTVSRAMLGGIAGAVFAALLIFSLYLFDPRIKSVEDVLPPEKATVLRFKDENAAVKLMARAKVAGARRIAILSLSEEEAYEKWTESFVKYLKRSGATVKVVCFTAKGTEWLSYFQTAKESDADYELYLYNEEVAGIAPYIAGNADMSVFFVNQRAVMAKTLQKNVAEISNDSYNCTILYNTDRAFVG